MLLFRSPTALLTIRSDYGYLRAELEPREGNDIEALDDELFRQAVDGERPEPGSRFWKSADSFVAFLQERLPEFERVALSTDPALRTRLTKLRAARAHRWESGAESMLPPWFGQTNIVERTVGGAVGGGGLAALALVVGLVRCVIAEVGGADVEGPTSGDLVVLVLYVTGFITAGAVVGAASPIGRFRLGALLLGLVGAGIVFTAIAFGEQGTPRHWDDATWFATIGCTVIFGLILAFQLYKHRPRAA